MENGYEFDRYRVFPSSRLFMRDNAEVVLGSRAFDLLVTLLLRAGDVVSHNELTLSAWGGLNVEESNLRVQMAKLRKELGCGKDGHRYIASVAGRGYIFVSSVEVVTSRKAERRPTDLAPAVPSSQDAGVPKLRSLNSRSLLDAEDRAVLGRDDDISAVVGLLEMHSFLTIFGPGGVGKSTLAEAVGHRVAKQHDAFLSIDLAETHPSDVNVEILASPGHPVKSLADIVWQLDENDALIIFDNCERVFSEVARLSISLAERIPRLRVIATSRAVTAAPLGSVYDLKALGFPNSIWALTPESAISFPSVNLFVECAIEGGFQSELTDDEITCVADICRKLEGNPWAIELVASRAASYGLKYLSEFLDSPQIFSWVGNRNAPLRHRSVKSMLDWSYSLLNDNEKRVFQRLAVFVGGFSLAAAISIATEKDLDEECAERCIISLISKSLVVVNKAQPNAQLQLDNLTRAYALLKFNETCEQPAVYARHSMFYNKLLGRELVDLEGGPEQDVIALTKADLGNIKAALERSEATPGSTEGVIPEAILAGSSPPPLRWGARDAGSLKSRSDGPDSTFPA